VQRSGFGDGVAAPKAHWGQTIDMGNETGERDPGREYITKPREALVVSVFYAKAGFEELSIQEFTRFVHASRQEAGCLLFDLYRISDRRSVFVLHEAWDSHEALEAHAENFHTTHFQVAIVRYLEQVVQTIEIEEVL
jgi:quinol monooxygenase YgiN